MTNFLAGPHSKIKILTILADIERAIRIVESLRDAEFGSIKDESDQGLRMYQSEMLRLMVNFETEHSTLSRVGSHQNASNLPGHDNMDCIADCVQDNVLMEPGSQAKRHALDGWLWIGQCLDSVQAFACTYFILSRAELHV